MFLQFHRPKAQISILAQIRNTNNYTIKKLSEEAECGKYLEETICVCFCFPMPMSYSFWGLPVVGPHTLFSFL
jgi:hypothetical protein